MGDFDNLYNAAKAQDEGQLKRLLESEACIDLWSGGVLSPVMKLAEVPLSLLL